MGRKKLTLRVQIKRYTLTLICLATFLPHGQSQNLLANGSFEDENTCTEYQVNCSPEAWISSGNGFSNYFKDPHLAFDGSHCMTIEAGKTRNKYQRTFIRSQLLCSLVKGNQYKFECYVKSPHPILDSIGIYFTSYDFLFDKNPLQKITPSLYFNHNEDHNVSSPDTNWKKITLYYTATGSEKFITIANFSKRDINSETGLVMENHFYVFVDKVSLTTTDPKEKICAGWQATKAIIYEQNERHQYLDRYVRFYRTQNKMPPPPALTANKMTRIDTLVLPDVLFATGKFDLQKNSYPVLEKFFQTINTKNLDSLVIEGHTDSLGNWENNRVLSEQRARAVAAYITSQSAFSNQVIITRGWGPLKPVAGNNTAAGRQKNRRVEILAYLRE
jgi:outer membrane protein OmpA-like peptidoglycan-associated protein